MVRMNPAGVPKITNIGEKLVYQRLSEIADHPDWVVFHSLKQSAVVQKFEAETDFLVLVPNKGIVIIEAKGATSVKLEGEEWSMEGVPPGTENKSPLKQIDGAKNNIRAYLRSNDIDVDSLPIARLVWLPKIQVHQFAHVGNTGMLIQTYEVAFNADLDKAAETIERAIDGQIAAFKDNPDVKYSPEKFDPNEMARIEKLLSVRLEATAKAGTLIDIGHTEISKATNDQIRILDLVRNNDNLFFSGPAGTGKSFLLASAAVELAKAGRKVLIACFSEMMADYYQINYGGHPNIEVYEIANLFLETTAYKSHKKSSEWFDDELPGAVLGRFKSSEDVGRYDVICIDEFQDIASKAKVVDAIFRYFKGDGDFKPQIILTADDHQQIMRGGDWTTSFDVAKDYFPEITQVTLSENCRQSPGLSDAVYEFLGWDDGKLKHKLSLELPWKLEIVRTKEGQETKDLASILRGLEKDYSPSQIRVLSPYGASSLIGNLFTRESNGADERWLKSQLRHSSSTGEIRWRSISKFKGLEDDVVVITDINQKAVNWLAEVGKNMNEVLYVGMTRAKFHLVLLISDGLYPAKD